MATAGPCDPTVFRIEMSRLWDAACANPADITPRLALADLVEVAGDRDHAALLRSPGLSRPHPTDARAFVRRFFPRLTWSLRRFRGVALTDARESSVLDPGFPFVHAGPRVLCLGIHHGAVEQIACPLRFWEGYGAGLVLSHPICAVRLSDRWPGPFGDGDRHILWHRGSHFGLHGLPADWLDYLSCDSELRDRGVRRVAYFATTAEALAAASAVALKYARFQVEPPSVRRATDIAAPAV